ncbi:MAG: LPS export ABC transporter permease LptG [Gemmatimonadota bacterium]
MTIVTRYMAREFLKMAAACTAGFLVLFLVIDFVERADDFLRHGAATGEIARYYLYRVPSIFVMISPVVVLLAVLITVSLRARANEFTALFSGGISLLRACAPLIVGCAAFSVLALGTSEILAPRANRGAREIARVRVRPEEVAAQFSLNRYWVRAGDAILSAQVVDAARGELHGFEYLEIDRDFRLVRRVDARLATAGTGGHWKLWDGKERSFPGSGEASAFKARVYEFPATIQTFLDGETPPDEMTYAQLADYIADARGRGYDVRRHEVDLDAKISYPLLNVIISMIAIPLSLYAPRKGGVWRSIGTGLLVGFFCWMALSASLSLGRKGMLPPAAAAWLPDVLFAAAGASLLRGTRR